MPNIVVRETVGRECIYLCYKGGREEKHDSVEVLKSIESDLLKE